MASLVATLAGWRRAAARSSPIPALGHAANFLYMLTGERPSALAARAFDVALVLHADHELNASTFAARVAAATLTDIHSAMVAAIGALKGPLHGGANADVMRLLLEIGEDATAPSGSTRSSAAKLARKEKIPGFGHRVYRTEDPRATHLRQMSRELGRARRHTALVRDVAADRGAREGREEAQSERRLLFGVDLLRARHSDRPVHADFRGEPHLGLDGARARAVREQPADPSARRVHGPAYPQHVRAAGSSDR